MRIGIDTFTLTRDRPGTKRYLSGLLNAISGLEVILLKPPKSLPSKNIITKICNAFIELFWSQIIIPFYVIFRKIDVLHSTSGYFSVLAPCPQILSIMDVNYMVYPQHFDYWWREYSKMLLKISAFLNSGIIITISDYSKEMIVKYFNISSKRIIVISPGISANIKSYNFTEKCKSLQPFILFVGALEPHKNIPFLIESFSQLINKYGMTDIHLLIVGKYSRGTRDILSKIDQLNVNKYTSLFGSVSENELEEIYLNASLFVFPSLVEGFGFPTLEAMIRGIPVVASDIPCNREVLGDSAIYFNPTDVSSLCEAIISVLNNDVLVKEMVSRGKKKAQIYSWERCAAMTVSVYRKVFELSLIHV